MIIHTDFTGGNIIVERIEEHTVYVERDIRDTEGDWFYWAFCVEPFTNRFCSFLCEETAEIHLNYTGNYDVGPNEQWNRENSPNSKNYFSKQRSVQLSVTLETPYFGLPETINSIPAMLELGSAFARAILRYIQVNT